MGTDRRHGPQQSRSKRHAERVRVTRACDRCKKRKIKCNGTRPCQICSKSNSDCTFQSGYARGRMPSIPNAYNGTPTTIDDTEVAIDHPSPSWDTLQPTSNSLQISARTGENNSPAGYLGAVPPSVPGESPVQASPHSSRTALHGLYLGDASGVSFIQRVQKRLDKAISFSHPGSIFTFGDAPLSVSENDPAFCMMLPKDHAQALFDRYFDFAMPTYRFLHRPTLQAWLNEFYQTLGSMHDAQSAPAKVALLFMVIAHGRMYITDDTGPPDLSLRLFLAAENQLSREKGAVRLISIQARLTMCFFLLTQSRINQCWNMFGTVSHLALAIGLHRSKRTEAPNGAGQIDAESRRRTFWCAYTLDAYLSVVLGRPRLFHDEDIDIELPADLDDDQLAVYPSALSPTPRTRSTMLAPIAHMKLAQITGKILRDLYPVKPISTNRRAVLNERIDRLLSDWRCEFAHFLEADYTDPSTVIFLRGQTVINLAYWHAIILTHRPLVLHSFTGYSNQQQEGSEDSLHVEESMQECMRVALNTVRTIESMTHNNYISPAYWVAAYYAFTATTLLYLYVLHRRTSPPEAYKDYLAAATKCQSHMTGIAEKGSLAERYCVLLEELRAEAVRQTQIMHPSRPESRVANAQWQVDAMQAPALLGTANPNGGAQYGDMMATADFNDMMMSGEMAFDYSGWTQFAEMVSSGLGNLDTFVTDDSYRF